MSFQPGPPPYHEIDESGIVPPTADMRELVRTSLLAVLQGDQRNALVREVKDLGTFAATVKDQFETILLALAQIAKGVTSSPERVALQATYEVILFSQSCAIYANLP